MVKQFRIDHVQGVEILVCEFFAKHTWNKDEVKAYQLYFDDVKKRFDMEPSRNSFRIDLDEWLDQEHEASESFFGLVEPIPIFEPSPHMVIRGAVVNGKIASVAADFAGSVTQNEVLDGLHSFFEFVRSPHWRNSIQVGIEKYGSLFGADNDS